MCGLFGKRAASPNPRLPPQHHPNLQHHPWRSRWTLFLFTICPILLQGNNLNLLFREKLSLCCRNWQLYSTVQFVSNRCQGGGSDQNVLEIQRKTRKYKIARGTTDPGYHTDRHIEFRKYKFAFFSKLNCHHNYSLVGLVWPNTEELISRPFMGLWKIRLLLQDRMRTKNVRN